MSENIGNILHANVTVGDVKCRSEINATRAAPSGEVEKLPSNQNEGGKDVGGDIEHQERKKKTRRRKPKRKNPYNKLITESRGQKLIRQSSGKRLFAQKQPVAPYNSNQFLIEDHNDLQDFDVKLMAVSAANRAGDNHIASISGLEPPRPGRVRDSSFTSADSDEDFFYSSPEDEEEFLTKEFSNTYQDLHVESLTQMSKPELIQQVLQLEEKVDTLEKRLGTKSKPEPSNKNDASEVGLMDKIAKFQQEISKLVLANEELQHENEILRRQRKCSVSSVDSESDSSSSSGSSDMTDSENVCSPSPSEPKNGSQTPHCYMNGDMNGEIDSNLMDTDSAR